MEDWTIMFAECSPCVAGQHGGYCQHVFALLMVVEAYAGKDVSLPGEQSVTSGKQRWGPRARNIEPQRVMSSTIERAKPDEERRGKAISSTLYEARGPKMQEMRHDATARLKCLLPAGCRMAGILPGQENFPNAIKSSFGRCLEGSPLSYYVRPAGEDTATDARQPVPGQGLHTAPPSVVLHSFPPLPLDRPPTDVLRYKQVGIPLQLARDVEKLTIGQSASRLWQKLHTFIITSSKFLRVISAKQASPALMSSLFQQKSLAHIPSIQHGHTYEAVAVREYVAVKKAESEPVVVKQCGLCLDTDFSFLGASPDRLVFDINRKEHGLVEVKCPFKHYHHTREEACRDPDFCCRDVDGIIRLKTGMITSIKSKASWASLDCHGVILLCGSDRVELSASVYFSTKSCGAQTCCQVSPSSTTPTHCHTSARSLLSHSVSRKPFLLRLLKHGRQILVHHRTRAVAFHAQ